MHASSRHTEILIIIQIEDSFIFKIFWQDKSGRSRATVIVSLPELSDGQLEKFFIGKSKENLILVLMNNE